MKLTRSKVALIAALALVLTVPLLAQMAGQGAPEKGCALPNLIAEQSAKIATLKVDQEKAMIQLQAALQTRRLELRQLMLEKADLKKLEAKIDEIAKAGADIQKSCLAHMIAVKALLTDEQKKAFEKMHGEMACASGMGMGRGHRMGMGEGGGCAGGCGGHMGCAGNMMGKMAKGAKDTPAPKDCDPEGCGSKTPCKK